MTTTTNPKFIEIAKQIEDLRDYGMFAKELSRGEVADAFEALLEITIPFAEVSAVKLAGPVTTDMLRHVQVQRGRPDLVAGALVMINCVNRPRPGRVIGACSGACFNVLSAEGQTWSVHPNDLTVVEENL